MASKLEILSKKKEINNKKILEFQEKIKFLQKENAKFEKEIEKEQNKQILHEIKEKNVSFEELIKLLKDKDTMYKNNNNYSNNDSNSNNKNNNFKNNNISNQERS